MPAESRVKQKATAIALHNPKKLYKRNKGLLKMSKKELNKFASTPTATLPERVEPAMPMQMPMKRGMCKGGVVKK